MMRSLLPCRLLRALVACTLAFTLPACRLTQTPRPTTNPAIVSPDPIPGVENFAQVSPVLYRGAQPTRQGFSELKARGVKAIVDLRTSDNDRAKLQGLGLRYFHIPSKADKPKTQDIAMILKIIQDPANQPVFIHCHLGSDRTGFAVAAYRMIEQGWSYDDATAEMDHFKFNHLFQSIRKHLRQLNIPQMKQTTNAIPSPQPEFID